MPAAWIDAIGQDIVVAVSVGQKIVVLGSISACSFIQGLEYSRKLHSERRTPKRVGGLIRGENDSGIRGG
jgi:hypothetical protein